MATESKPIELGLPCPTFSLPGVDGKLHGLDDYRASDVLVIGFTCNHCPYVQAYEMRLVDLVKELRGKSVSFLCINSNDEKKYPEDSFEEMKIRAQKLGFNFDYLRDESQQTAKAFNAACTPEFFVYGKDRRLSYHGRLDDNHKNAKAAKEHYLKEAILSLLEGSTPKLSQTSAIGCGIKWK